MHELIAIHVRVIWVYDSNELVWALYVCIVVQSFF